MKQKQTNKQTIMHIFIRILLKDNTNLPWFITGAEIDPLLLACVCMLYDTFWSSSTAIEPITRVPVLNVLTIFEDWFVVLPQYPEPFHQSAQVLHRMYVYILEESLILNFLTKNFLQVWLHVYVVMHNFRKCIWPFWTKLQRLQEQAIISLNSVKWSNFRWIFSEFSLR
jgi:hypothetical protein